MIAVTFCRCGIVAVLWTTFLPTRPTRTTACSGAGTAQTKAVPELVWRVLLWMMSGRKSGSESKQFHACHLRELVHMGLLGYVWPRERVVMGMAVSNWIRAELPVSVYSVSFVTRKTAATGAASFAPQEIGETLFKFQGKDMWLTWQEPACTLAAGLSAWGKLASHANETSDCLGLTQLDASNIYIETAATAEKLAGVLGSCKSLTHLSISTSNLYWFSGYWESSLGGCRKLKHLNLNCNKIGYD
eukprot:398415-Rhodomonas_salina.2